MIGSAIYVMGIQKFRTLSHGRMGLGAATLQIFSRLVFSFVVNMSRKYNSGMYISYSAVQKDFLFL
jgi:hypothetical protein